MLRFLFLICAILSQRSRAEIFEAVALTDEDFANANKLTKEDIYASPVPIETVNGYKSDIRGPIADAKRFRRNGVSRPTKLWPHARIPYAISPHYSSHERALLARAVKQYHDKTCVRFVPRAPGEGDYLFIGKVDGCFSEVGRTSGVQVLSLDNGCMEYPTIIHEMMHVVGFYHEHERWDRDNFIDIIWQNIDRGALDQFGKVDLSKTSYYGQPYDYKSILHYDSLAFSKNGFPTMLPKKPGLASTIGNAKDFSEVDLAKINRMYKCDRVINTPYSLSPKARISPIYSPPPWKNVNRPVLEGHSFYDEHKNSNKKVEMKKYKWFLLNNAIWDLLFNVTVSFLFAPEPILAELAGALIVTSGLSFLGFEYAKWITMFTNGVLVGSCAAVCACFIFRYFCLQSKDTFEKFLSLKVQGLLWFCYGLIIVITLFLTNMAIVEPLKVIYKFRALRPSITNEFFIAFDISENRWLIIAVLWAAGGVGTMTTINFSCTFLILKKLNSVKMQLSAQTYKMHKELMKALLCQTLSPLLALIVPFSGMVFSSALKIELPFGPNWFIFVSTLNAVLNPLFTLYFVKAFWYQIFPKRRVEPERTTTQPGQNTSQVQTFTSRASAHVN